VIPLLSDNDAEKLILSACEARPHTEDDLTKIIDWANAALLDKMLLGMVIDGKMIIEWGDGEPNFKAKS